MKKYTTSEARKKLSEIILNARYGKERALITKSGKPIAAIVPISDLSRLEVIPGELIQKE